MSRRRRRRRGIPGVSFSWRRALGISGAKARLSRQLGVPLTRSGRQRKVGRMLGSALPAGLLLLGLAAAAGGMAVLVRDLGLETWARGRSIARFACLGAAADRTSVARRRAGQLLIPNRGKTLEEPPRPAVERVAVRRCGFSRSNASTHRVT